MIYILRYIQQAEIQDIRMSRGLSGKHCLSKQIKADQFGVLMDQLNMYVFMWGEKWRLLRGLSIKTKEVIE